MLVTLLILNNVKSQLCTFVVFVFLLLCASRRTANDAFPHSPWRETKVQARNERPSEERKGGETEVVTD
jgi:hypothetical protein